MGSLDWLMRLHPASYPSLWLASRSGICAFRHIESISSSFSPLLASPVVRHRTLLFPVLRVPAGPVSPGR